MTTIPNDQAVSIPPIEQIAPGSSEVLAETGSDLFILVIVAVILIVLGATVLATRKRYDY